MYSNLINGDKSLQNNLIFTYMRDYIDKWLITKDDDKLSIGLFEKDFIENVAEEIYYVLLK